MRNTVVNKLEEKHVLRSPGKRANHWICNTNNFYFEIVILQLVKNMIISLIQYMYSPLTYNTSLM